MVYTSTKRVNLRKRSYRHLHILPGVSEACPGTEGLSRRWSLCCGWTHKIVIRLQRVFCNSHLWHSKVWTRFKGNNSSFVDQDCWMHHKINALLKSLILCRWSRINFLSSSSLLTEFSQMFSVLPLLFQVQKLHIRQHLHQIQGCN